MLLTLVVYIYIHLVALFIIVLREMLHFKIVGVSNE